MANLGVDGLILDGDTRRRTRASKAGSSRSHEQSYIQTEGSYLKFIKIETKNYHPSIPCSSSLTKRFFGSTMDSKCFNPGRKDELFVRVGILNKLMVNSDWSARNPVEEFDISPREKYLVTYNKPDPSDPKGLWLKIFDVRTGTGIFGLYNGDVADSPEWPVIRWAGGKDDEFFAILGKNKTVSVYETKTFNPLGNAPLLLDDVIDISWSPTEAVLAIILLKTGGKKPVKALLWKIPNKVKLAEKDLTAFVGDCKMYWQSNGEYLAVSTCGGFVFFRIKEEGIPTDFLKVDKKILAFAWEPSGHRFAVIYRDEPNPSVSFYSMKNTPGKVTELTTLSNKQADALFWSPRGNLIVLAGLKEGKLEFFDVDRLVQTSSVDNVKANKVVWDPLGKYVATVFTRPEEKFNDPEDPLNRFTIWSSGGDCLHVQQCNSEILQLDWRPYGGIIDEDMLKAQLRRNAKIFRY